MSDRSFYLIAYDISNNKRRAKIAKIMESMGARVQGSVFEIFLSSKEREILGQRCKKVINLVEDSIRFYFICGSCREKLVILGQGKKNEIPEVVIV